MRTTLWSLIVVTVLALALCAFSLLTVSGEVERADRERLLAVQSLDRGQLPQAQEALARLDRQWQSVRPGLSVLCAHSALDEVDAALSEARACLESGDVDEGLRALIRLKQALYHLRDVEEATIINLC